MHHNDTALDKLNRLASAAARLCHHTAPDTPYAHGVFSRPFVDAIQDLRRSVADVGTTFASEWKYEVIKLKEGPEETYSVKATSKEGLVRRLRERYGYEDSAYQACEAFNAATHLQPDSPTAWEECPSKDRNYYLDRDPYDFFEETQGEVPVESK